MALGLAAPAACDASDPFTNPRPACGLPPGAPLTPHCRTRSRAHHHPAAAAPPGAASPAFVKRYVAILSRRRGWAAVFLIWACVAAAGAFGAIRTFGNLRLQLDPIPGDANDLAARALGAHFPRPSSNDAFFALVELRTADGSNITGLEAASASEDRLARFSEPFLASGLLLPGSADGFFRVSRLGMGSLASAALSPSASSVAVPFYSDEPSVTPRAEEFLLSLRRELRAIESDSGGRLIAAETGWLPISYDSSKAILHELTVSDAATVSLSFLVLACVLGRCDAHKHAAGGGSRTQHPRCGAVVNQPYLLLLLLLLVVPAAACCWLACAALRPPAGLAPACLFERGGSLVVAALLLRRCSSRRLSSSHPVPPPPATSCLSASPRRLAAPASSSSLSSASSPPSAAPSSSPGPSPRRSPRPTSPPAW